MKRTRHGFSLIEVLVALLILSIGLAGMANFQLRTMQGAHSSFLRSMASVIASDAEERLWIALDKQEEVGDCPDLDEVAAEQMAALRNPDLAKLPAGLEIDLEIAETAASGAWSDVTIAVAWPESRFADQLPDGEVPRERFEYRARILCKPYTGES